MPKGSATLSDLRIRICERLYAAGCACHSTGDQCMLCAGKFRLRRLVNDYGYKHVFVDAGTHSGEFVHTTKATTCT